MASLTRGTTFVDGVANDVTAAKLSALVDNATPTSGFIQDRTAETITATNDTLLIGDASDSNNLKRITVANFAQTLPTAKVTTGTIDTGTFGTTTSTAATITTGTITNLVSTTGTVATLNSTTGTVATLNSTTGTITTGVIPTLTSITKITSGTGTAASPAISPTGDANTGIFFPALDTIAFSPGGVEAMRIDSNQNVGIGCNAASSVELDVQGGVIRGKEILLENGAASSPGLGTTPSWYSPASGVAAISTNGTERLRIDSSGNVGVNTTSASAKLDTRTTGDVWAGRFLNSSSLGNPNGLQVVVGQNATNAVFEVGCGTDYSAPISLLKVVGSGNVSIGTATALSKLHVHGDLTMSNATTAVTASTSTITPPATVAGYLTVSINGTSRKIAYYAT